MHAGDALITIMLCSYKLLNRALYTTVFVFINSGYYQTDFTIGNRILLICDFIFCKNKRKTGTFDIIIVIFFTLLVANGIINNSVNNY